MYSKCQQSFRYLICAFVLLTHHALRSSDGKRYSKILAPEIIATEGFPCEIHLVTTEDGYILTIHRIPGPSGSTPVYIQHGLAESSTDFLYNGKNGSIAFLLSRMGYDVWLGNSRGNIYSRLHANYTTDDPSYWDFSWDELGYYDIPAAISYIHNKTNEKLFYIGHSMGCSTFSVMAIEKPQVAENVKAMFALAPAIYATYNRQPLFQLLSHFWKVIWIVSRLINYNEALGRNALYDFSSDYLCRLFLVEYLVCENIILFDAGFNRPELPKHFAPKFLSKMPAGTSVKLLTHYFQQIRNLPFRRFNYPTKGQNIKHYKSHEPPEYDLTKIQVPVAVFYSHNDRLVGAKDAQRFYEQVPNKLGIHEIEPYDHFDFLTGVHAAERVYSTIFKLMSKFE